MIGVSNRFPGSKQGAPGHPRLESSNSVLVRNRDRLGDQVIGSSESEYCREKEFLRDFIAEIGINPDSGQGDDHLLRAARIIFNEHAGGPRRNIKDD